jgi:hypothetical protein
MKFGDDPAISSGVRALFVFSVLAAWWPSQDWTEIWSVSYSYLVVHMYNVSGQSIVPAVTKRAVLTNDDDDGDHMSVATLHHTIQEIISA